MGGMQATTICMLIFQIKLNTAIPIACTASHSAQNIALNELGRQAIMADNNWSEWKL